MTNIFALARLVMVSGLRSNFLIGLIVFSLSCEVASLYFMSFFPHDIGRISVDFIVSISFIAGLLFLFFYAIQLISIDGDHQSIFLFLSKPLSRGHYVLGVFCGCAILIILLNILLALSGFGLLYYIRFLVTSSYFPNLSIPYYILAFVGLTCIELMILAVIVLVASVVRGSFLVMLLTLSYYLICNGLPIVREAIAQNKEPSIIAAGFTKWLTLLFPNFEKFDYKYLISQIGELDSLLNVAWSGTYFISYIIVILVCSIVINNRRDII